MLNEDSPKGQPLNPRRDAIRKLVHRLLGTQQPQSPDQWFSLAIKAGVLVDEVVRGAYQSIWAKCITCSKKTPGRWNPLQCSKCMGKLTNNDSIPVETREALGWANEKMWRSRNRLVHEAFLEHEEIKEAKKILGSDSWKLLAGWLEETFRRSGDDGPWSDDRASYSR